MSGSLSLGEPPLTPLQLSDLYSSYLPRTTPNFQTYISSKWEFAQLSNDANERLPYNKRGALYSYQEYYVRFLRMYDKLFINDDPGVGKSCSVFNLAERIRKNRILAKAGDPRADEKLAHIKRVIILIRGPTHRQEARNQLVCRCSDGFYTDNVSNNLEAAFQKSSLTRVINKAGYVMKTYGTFAKDVRKFTTTKELMDAYNDSLFWIDEAHNLLIDPDTDTGKTKPREKHKTYNTIHMVLHVLLRCKIILTTATPGINGPGEIVQLMNLLLPLNGQIPRGYDFHQAPANDLRVLFPTVDPNFVRQGTQEEVSPYYRGQIPDNFKFDGATVQDIEPYIRGLVGWIKASDVGTTREYQTNPEVVVDFAALGKSRPALPLFLSQMSPHQQKGYLSTLENERDIYASQRQASNFVFPDGKSGTGITSEERAAYKAARKAHKKTREIDESIQQYAEATDDLSPIWNEETLEDDNILQYQLISTVPLTMIAQQSVKRQAFRRYVLMETNGDFAATDEFKRELLWGDRPSLTLARISYFGCKFGKILENIFGCLGKWYCYGELHGGSGNIVLGLCCEALGYIRFNDKNSIFQSAIADKAKPICISADLTDYSSIIRPDMLPSDPDNPDPSKRVPYRYIILSQYSTEAQFSVAMEAFNSRQNLHGRYIKGVISSRVGRDGVNLNDTIQIHLENAEWNESSRLQAESRALRAVSHDALLAVEQERLRREGKDPSTARIQIKIFNHAAITYRNELQYFANSVVNTVKLESIDIYMYQLAAEKDISIKHALKLLRECSINCQVFYGRNHPKDQLGAPQACVNPQPTAIDFSTYDVYYSDQIADTVIGLIRELFRVHFKLSFTELLEYVTPEIANFRINYLILALERMVDQTMPLTNRLGYVCYLQEDQGIFYLSTVYPDAGAGNNELAYYTANVVSLILPSLITVAEDSEKIELPDMLEAIANMDPNSAEFDQYMNSLPITSEVELLEQSWLSVITGQNNPAISAVLRRYHSLMFDMPEPVQEINEERNRAWSGSKRGPKPNLDLKRRVEHIQKGKITEMLQRVQLQQQQQQNQIGQSAPETVYVHTLFSTLNRGVGYGLTNRINKGEGVIKLLKPSEGIGWREVNVSEYTAYNVNIQLQIASRLNHLETDPRMVYGMISYEEKPEVFRLRIRYTEKDIAKSDGRHINHGQVCATKHTDDLTDLMWRIRTPLPYVPNQPENFGYPQTEYERQAMINTILNNSTQSKSYGKRDPNKRNEMLYTWPADQVYFYWRWVNTPKRITRENKCGVIRSKLIEQNLIRYLTVSYNVTGENPHAGLVRINTATGQPISPSGPTSPYQAAPYFPAQAWPSPYSPTQQAQQGFQPMASSSTVPPSAYPTPSMQFNYLSQNSPYPSALSGPVLYSPTSNPNGLMFNSNIPLLPPNAPNVPYLAVNTHPTLSPAAYSALSNHPTLPVGTALPIAPVISPIITYPQIQY